MRGCHSSWHYAVDGSYLAASNVLQNQNSMAIKPLEGREKEDLKSCSNCFVGRGFGEQRELV